MLWSILHMSLREIRRNTMRSFLTMLGVVIGVGAVIAMVSIGQGATASVTERISALGDNLLILSPGADRHHGAPSSGTTPFEMSDVAAIRKQISGLKAIAPTSAKAIVAVYGNTNWRTQIYGSTPAFFEVRNYTIAQGRLLNAADESGAASVCVIGETTRKELFGRESAIGAAIRLGRTPCTVIGVLTAKGSSAMGSDQDDLIVMPLTAVQRRIVGNRDIPTVFVSVTSKNDTSRVKAQIESLLRERRHVAPGAEDDFNVRDMQEIVDTVSQTTGALTALLGAIAAVSLLVGGIGIMNIMLVSVTERTREIGIRLAIGALGNEVLLQFLVEAIVLSTLGGVIGVVLGTIGAYAATHSMGLPFVVSPGLTILAFVFSALVGVLFGYLPARKAARLNPIDALRHE
jgi:putative ABC transport system permease protein